MNQNCCVSPSSSTTSGGANKEPPRVVMRERRIKCKWARWLEKKTQHHYEQPCVVTSKKCRPWARGKCRESRWRGRKKDRFAPASWQSSRQRRRAILTFHAKGCRPIWFIRFSRWEKTILPLSPSLLILIQCAKIANGRGDLVILSTQGSKIQICIWICVLIMGWWRKL